MVIRRIKQLGRVLIVGIGRTRHSAGFNSAGGADLLPKQVLGIPSQQRTRQIFAATALHDLSISGRSPDAHLRGSRCISPLRKTS
jgi:hypothetical protein